MPPVSTPSSRDDRPVVANTVGTLAAVAGLTCKEFGFGPDRMTLFIFTNVAITVTDNGSTGSVGTKLYDYPKGLIDVAGGVSKLTYAYTSATDANLTSAVGSVTAAADGTLASTEQDLIPSTATAIASSVGTFSGKTVTRPTTLLDGTATAKSVFFNMATSSDPGASAVITVNGWILVKWANLGDFSIALPTGYI